MPDTVRLAGKCIQDSTVDGPGLRIVIWTQGCFHNCEGCHNPATHDPNGGIAENVENIIGFINNSKLQRGITLSGGEPFLQARQLMPIVDAAIEKGMNVWIYSGYTYEQLMEDDTKKALLEKADILVDGPFVLALKDTRLAFKGSKNQRIIDVKASKEAGKAVISKYDDINMFI
jgi:anaerobic ribonucleoside-triphosphate reductase activating protein